MGPNGSGKSTLAFSLTGHPQYDVEGSVSLDGEDILALAPDKRARAGLFLSFQYPAAIPGVKVANFLHAARQAERPNDPLPPAKFRALLLEKMEQLGIDPSFMGRYLNDGFSGGEKKRLEMLQLAVLAPRYAILDETDSGLDIDALKDVGNSIAVAARQRRRPRHRLLDHHALSAHSPVRRCRRRAHYDRRAHRQNGRTRSGASRRARRLRHHSRRDQRRCLVRF